MQVRIILASFVAALSLAGLTAGSASAAFPWGESLQLTEQGHPVSPGTPIENEQGIIGHCLLESSGKVLNNGDSVDALAIRPPTAEYTSCEHGSSVTGGISYAALAANGTALLYASPTIALTVSASCTYDFWLLQGTFHGEAFITGTATGLRSRSSSPSCTRSLETGFSVAELGLGTDEPLGAELMAGPRF